MGLRTGSGCRHLACPALLAPESPGWAHALTSGRNRTGEHAATDISFAMKQNENATVIGEKCVLVPYRKEHVARYHEWMVRGLGSACSGCLMWLRGTSAPIRTRGAPCIAERSGSARSHGIRAAEPGGGVRHAAELAPRPQECVRACVRACRSREGGGCMHAVNLGAARVSSPAPANLSACRMHIHCAGPGAPSPRGHRRSRRR